MLVSEQKFNYLKYISSRQWKKKHRQKQRLKKNAKPQKIKLWRNEKKKNALPKY